MKPLVIYHANCADGFGAAFAAWTKLGDEAEYLPCQHGTDYSLSENTFEFNGREIYILDFSFSKSIMEMLFVGVKRVVWLDHHKTAFEMWCGGIPDKGWLSELRNCTPDNLHGNIEIHLDNGRSGAMIAWEYFHPGTEVPMLIKHIDDYDRWQFKIEGTKAFNKALWSYAPWSFEQWEGLVENEYDPETMHVQYVIGNAILRAHDQNVQSVVKGAARKCSVVVHGTELIAGCLGEYTEHSTFSGLGANCPPHLTSDVGHELANQSGTFGLCWTLSQEDFVAKCSLRSNGDYDVSAIAKSFGGGGHRNAAGFEVPIDVLLGWLK